MRPVFAHRAALSDISYYTKTGPAGQSPGPLCVLTGRAQKWGKP